MADGDNLQLKNLPDKKLDGTKKINNQELERARKIVLDSIGEKDNVLEKKDILKPVPEKIEIRNGLSAEQGAENFSIKIEKILPAEEQKNIPADGLIQASNQQYFQKEKQKEIEKILEAGLEDIYLSLSPEKQREFKMEGEKTTREINILLNKTKINIGKIIALIRRWLLVIPGINKFFLEQEAKIKADEIVKLKER